MKKKSLYFLLVLLVIGVFYIIFFRQKEAPRPNIILISIDTLRANHMGCYGYWRDTSPHLDALAKENILFERTYAPSSLTAPSHVSLFTSLYPLSHRILGNSEVDSFSSDAAALAELLKSQGYRTGGFSGGGQVSEVQGFRRGFDTWSEKRNIVPHMPFVKEWLSKKSEEKFFLFFHFYDVHGPYPYRKNFAELYRDVGYIDELKDRADRIWEKKKSLPIPYDQLTTQNKIDLGILKKIQGLRRTHMEVQGDQLRRDEDWLLTLWERSQDYERQLQMVVDSYDAGIKYTDFHLNRFFRFLKEEGLWDSTLLIVTSDHGEEFMEHKILGHGKNLYESLAHVPLIVKMPASFGGNTDGSNARRVTGLTELVDIMPTVLDLLKIRLKDQMQGESLLPLIKGKRTSGKKRVFASLHGEGFEEKRTVRSERWRYMIFHRDFSEKDEFFDVREDPLEQRNLIGEKIEDMQILKSELLKHMRDCTNLYNSKYSKNRKSINDYPEALREKRLKVLRTLGYIN
jgi:arylsulfatase A-like enzyme